MKFLTLTLHTLLIVTNAFSQLVINEVMTSSDEDFIDGIKYSGDWIELYNNSNDTLYLSEWQISDEGLMPDFYQLPELIVEPKGFALLLADDDTIIDNGFAFLPFKLNSSGETVYLFKNQELYSITEIPSLDENQSYGRFPDASDIILELPKPSPSKTNLFSDILSFSHESGFYSESIVLEIESKLGLEIRFSDEGSTVTSENELFPKAGLFLDNATNNPNRFSVIPTTPPNNEVPTFNWVRPNDNVEKLHVLRFSTFYEGVMVESDFASFYISKYADSRFQIPVVSLYGNPEDFFSDIKGIYVPGNVYKHDTLSGNYFMRGRDWEREVCLDYFSSNGERLLNQKVGVRTRGNTTRASVQKSLRLYARDEYGDDRLEYDFFDASFDNYEKLELANSISEWSAHTYIRNQIMYELAKQIGLDHTETYPVSVFINGEYWGLHTLRERMDEDLLSERYDIDKDSINVLSRFEGFTDHGTNRHFKEVMQIIDNSDLTDNEVYAEVSNSIDIDNFINYMILYNFCAIIDWPNNNFEHWNALGVGQKIRFLPVDGDSGFYDPEYNMLMHSTQDSIYGIWPNGAEYTLLFRKLLLNKQFEDQFLGRYDELLNTVFRTHNIRNIIYTQKKRYLPEVDDHIRRFPFPPTLELYDYHFQLLDDFIERRPCEVEQNLKEKFPQHDFDFSCSVNSLFEQNEVIVYPNPTADYLSFDLSKIGAEPINIKICSINGETQLYQELTGSENLINVASIEIGTYIILFNNAEGKLLYSSIFTKI